AFSLKLPLYLPVIALIYFAEVLSVIMQVLYFKATKGKRIFKMTPIHHHFELSGWSEPKVVAVFATVTLVLGAFVLLFI
ncbi:MAG: phospho-N-acetylmuramoyl-pentapeptide-transferase, partial [Lachnospiraceae bacterium]|nr:phospho-N-acetylmuramoyl-pentapeptide-transferase [Lachnospiraceae bacterium]